ncbi:tyrosine-type recombinase/integrase [Paenibacillus roseus]|uniref:tyrosine-type recombinase/integrase n=1 Tax=Paenibacillus sp. GCM10012307 TaxID=3317343 RepID=UPI0036D2ED54
MNYILTAYADWLQEKESSNNTVDRYITVASSFMQWYSGSDLTNELFDPQNVSASDLQQWKQHLLKTTYLKGGKERKYSISTVNNSIKSIRTFFTFLKETGVIERNPGAKLKTQNVSTVEGITYDKVPRWLERSERNKLVRFMNTPIKNSFKFTRNRAIVFLQLLAGLRAGEVVALDTDDLDFNSGYIFVRDGKGGKARRIEMNKELRDVLKEWLIERDQVQDKTGTRKLFLSIRGGALTEDGIEYLYTTLRAKTGILDLTSHVPRHTLAHDLITLGYPLQRVADILGHSSLDHTRIYTISSSKEMRVALDSLSVED